MNVRFLLAPFALLLGSDLFLRGVDSARTDLAPAVLLRHLDSNTLSRLYAFKQYIAGVKYDLRPAFRNGWIYHSKMIDNLTRRLGMYGYGIAALNSPGNGNCMFYSIQGLFRLNGLTNKRLLEYLNPDLEFAVQVAVRGILENEKELTALNLKRISQIYWMGVDPYDFDSVQYFNPSGVRKRMELLSGFQSVSVGKTMNDDYGTQFNGVDMISYYEKFKKGDKIKVLKELDKEFEARFLNRLGDHQDLQHLEFVFQLNFLMMDRKKSTVGWFNKKEDFVPKAFMAMIYEDACHYDIAGFFKLGSTDPKDIKTMFTVADLPLPLFMFMAEDSLLKPKI